MIESQNCFVYRKRNRQFLVPCLVESVATCEDAILWHSRGSRSGRYTPESRSLHAQVNVVQRDRAAATELTFQRRRFSCDRGDLLTASSSGSSLNTLSLSYFRSLRIHAYTRIMFTYIEIAFCTSTQHAPLVPYDYPSCLPNHPPIYACECVALRRTTGLHRNYTLLLLLLYMLALSKFCYQKFGP